MSVSYELLEEYTGTRTQQMPDPDNEGETISSDAPCRDIMVKFTCADSDCVHERSVNVCFDSEGNYDHEATLVRVGEVANGVASKIAVGVISSPTE